MQSWNNKVVVITGGTAGIGKALALASQQAGAQTVVIARSTDGPVSYTHLTLPTKA